LHACLPTIRTGLLPFGEHWLAGSHGGGGINRRPGVGSADHSDHSGRHPWYKQELNRRFVRLSSMVTTVGGHWELRTAALLKAVWWGMRLASLLTQLCFVFVFESNISGTAERICAKFTGKTCLVPRSVDIECQCQRSKVKVTRDKNALLAAITTGRQRTCSIPSLPGGDFGGLRAVCVW